MLFGSHPPKSRSSNDNLTPRIYGNPKASDPSDDSQTVLSMYSSRQRGCQKREPANRSVGLGSPFQPRLLLVYTQTLASHGSNLTDAGGLPIAFSKAAHSDDQTTYCARTVSAWFEKVWRSHHELTLRRQSHLWQSRMVGNFSSRHVSSRLIVNFASARIH